MSYPSQPFPRLVAERKSRRTHKNSRDGCPNCKAKRIKCSEELPSCSNCIKKNYRCGYLDFPPEKLEHLRKKNDKRNRDISQYNDNQLLASTNLTPSQTNTLNDSLSSHLHLQHHQHQPNFSPDNSSLNNTPITKGSPSNIQPFTPLSNVNSNSGIPYPDSIHSSNHNGTIIDNSVTGSSITNPSSPANYHLHISYNDNHYNNNNNLLFADPNAPPPNDIFAHAAASPQNVDPSDFYISKDELRVALYKDSLFKLGSNEAQWPHPLQRQQLDQLKFGFEDQNQQQQHQQQNNNSTHHHHRRHHHQLSNDQQQFQSPQQPFIPPQQYISQGQQITQQQALQQSPQDEFFSGSYSTSNEDDNLSSHSFENSTQNYNRHIHSLDPNVSEISKHLHLDDIPEDHNNAPFQFPRKTDTPQQYLFTLNNNIVHNYSPPSHPPSHPGTPLNNAISMPFICSKLVKTYKRKHELVSGQTVLDINNVSFFSLYSPVWRFENMDIFWTAVFNKSIVLDVYFSFFMDRALNVLIKVVNKAVNAESNPTTFTAEDLSVLTKKSYNYYGVLIKELRESLTKIHIEYPIKISMYSGWTTYLHLHASVDTIALMHTGTASLFNNYVQDLNKVEEITPTLQASIQNYNNHISYSVVPDYKFDIIKELYEDFLEFKTFIIHNQELTTKNNGIILNTFVELEDFLKDLIEELYPKMLYVNNFYKKSNNITDKSDNIIFTSPSLLFDLLTRWFRIFPSEAISIGSRMTPLQKTFYLFFNAVGKAMSHVVTPLRSVMLVDALHVIVPIVGLDCVTYKFGVEDCPNAAQYTHLAKLSTKLIRIIKFFNNRVELVSYYLSNKTILKDSPYLSAVKPQHDRVQFHGGDILQFNVPKFSNLTEVMMTNFNVENAIGLWNYPLLPSLAHERNDFNVKEYGSYKEMIETENENQHERLKNAEYDPTTIIKEFNYDIGMFSFDFNLTVPLQAYFRASEAQWNFTKLPIEEVKIRLKYFEDSRRELAKAIAENHAAEE
ncbi:hypothetical protein DFJ63DRAFT_312841 [Scheffersomyces coipomensis]|uniref:uncharacterized protein n=1 Tax=Scheffersomyces coipomensis TaxID=1788519 RepID=UPI00315C5D73